MTDSNSRSRFSSRAFVSGGMALSGAALPLTGVMNHVLQFEPMTVARHAWMSAHSSIGILFILFAVWHAILNRRALVGYFRRAMDRSSILRPEILCAGLVVTLTTLLIVSHAFHAR